VRDEVAGTAGGDDVAVMRQPIVDSRGDDILAELLSTAVEGFIGVQD